MSAPRSWRVVLDQASVPGYGDSSFAATRASNDHDEMVFLEHNGDLWWMTREQAADLAEVLHTISGMATSAESAWSVAESVSATLRARGISQSRVSAETGITRYRLRRILSADAPMTTDELKAISGVGAGTSHEIVR